MERTQFAGLTQLAPGEPLSTDGFSFQARNPGIIDQFLKIGAVTHKHDGHAALARPEIEPSATAIASGGTFPADVALMIGYTAVDAQGGETLVSPVISVTTPPLIESPFGAPSAAADYSGGELRADTYYFVKTWIDDGGGETPPSPYAEVARSPGFASGQVRFYNLASGMAAAGAVGWKLYKANSTGQFKYLASGTTDEFTDDGTICADCVTAPPTTNTTHQRNTLLVEVPGSMPPGAISFRVYVSLGAGFFDPSLMGDYAVASAGQTFSYNLYNPSSGRPPDIATAIGGANQIDPDTDILDWHWKRPVTASAALASGSRGDVRLVFNEHAAYGVFGSGGAISASDWAPIAGDWHWASAVGASALLPAGRQNDVRLAISERKAYAVFGSGGASGPLGWTPLGGSLTIEGASAVPSIADVDHLRFVASGGASVSIVDNGGGRATVTVSASGAGGGSPSVDGWTNFANEGSWNTDTSWDDPSCAYTKDPHGTVHTRGAVISVAAFDFSTTGSMFLATLPANYAPAGFEYFTVPMWDAGLNKWRPCYLQVCPASAIGTERRIMVVGGSDDITFTVGTRVNLSGLTWRGST